MTESVHSYLLTHQVRLNFILKKIQEIALNKKLMILDVGCYPYHIGKALETLGHFVYGISSKHEPVKKENVAILNIEKDEFPYKDDFFDLVLFNEVIEHLSQSPVIPLKEIYRVTKKEGYLMVTTPNIVRSINRLKLFLGKTIMYPLDVFFENEGRGNNIYHRHNREYTLDEVLELLTKTSWKIIENQTFISYTPFRKRVNPDTWWLGVGKFINYLLMLAIPSFRDTIFIFGKK